MVAFLLATLKPHNGSTITKKDAPISHSETSAVESVALGPEFQQVRWLSILGTPKKRGAPRPCTKAPRFVNTNFQTPDSSCHSLEELGVSLPPRGWPFGLIFRL